MLLAVTVLAGGCGGGDDGDPVILATTTSTQDSGLLDVSIPAFERNPGVR